MRATYIIDSDGVLRHMSINDLPVGRNIDEILRLVKAFQYSDKSGEVCPAQWQPINSNQQSQTVSVKNDMKWT